MGTNAVCAFTKQMPRKFEEFTFRSIPASRKQPRVAIQTRGNMSLNEAAFEALGKPEKVILLFDKDTNAVGLKATEEKVRYAFPIRRQSGSKSYLIGSASFCQHYGIDTSITKAFEPVLEEGILVFEIDEGAPVITSRGRPKRPI